MSVVLIKRKKGRFAESKTVGVRELTAALRLLRCHEDKFQRSFYMVPSENVLSPIARVPFFGDAYSRYFFNESKLWGSWAFNGGKWLGAIEKGIVVPRLLKLTQARFVEIRPISGLNCMTTTLAGLCRIGDKILTVNPAMGGHTSTAEVARRLGLRVEYLPSESAFTVDHSALQQTLAKSKVRLIYIDQSTVLFPLDVHELVKVTKKVSRSTLVHVDSSHLNGLILGGALPNPLLEGADSFGGSMHKTFAGPHKAFYATNSSSLIKSLDKSCAHFVSHTHMADTASLAIALIEFDRFGGKKYAAQICSNAVAFAKRLYERGLRVQGKEYGFTRCHQVWIDTSPYCNAYEASRRLYDVGLIVNAFGSLPGLAKPGLRLSLAEVTRFGFSTVESRILADLFADTIKDTRSLPLIRTGVSDLRARFSSPHFCGELKEWGKFQFSVGSSLKYPSEFLKKQK